MKMCGNYTFVLSIFLVQEDMDPALAIEADAISRHKSVTEGIEKGGTVKLHYEGATAFVTGASGFLGKQLIEKLIRSTDIKKVYLLLRPKKGNTIEERLKQIVIDPVYDELHEKQPGFTEKLVPVAGDIAEVRLGISPEQWKALSDEVEIIIHIAATVSFDEPIKMATLTNVRGTREVIRLGQDCRRLRSFVHVSTAYSHAIKSRINTDIAEKFYNSPVNPQFLIEMVETMDEERLNDMTAGLTRDWPNTYSFTKAVAEELVRTAGDLPICIVRPAIVIASHNEPKPGWLDPCSATGATGVVYGAGLGLVHIWRARDVNMDIVPVDLVNNAILAAGWHTACLRDKGAKDKRIYTVAAARNPLNHNFLKQSLLKNKYKYASPKAMWYCSITFTDNKMLYVILSWLLHFIPAYFADAICWVLGKPRRFVTIYRKADKLINLLAYFSCNEWKFSDDNLLNMFNTMSTTDQIIYNFDMACINWDEHAVKWILGIRKYIIKDGLIDTEYGERKQYWFKILHYLVVFLYFYVFWKLISLLFCIVG